MPISDPFAFFIQLHITERCNLRCSHCYQDGDRSGEMTLVEITSIADEVSEMITAWEEAYAVPFESSFTVTGGEPFLRNDFSAILDALRRRGFDTYILTNGTLISRERARELADLGVRGVQISLEGPEQIHDSIRGAGSFSASMNGIQNIVSSGIELTLNTTLSEINAPYFMEMISLASDLGAQKLGFSRLVPSGGGKRLISRMLSSTAVEDLYRNIFSPDTGNSTGDLKIVTGDPVASQYRSPDQAASGSSVPSGGCAAGVSGLTILPDGTVTPCRRLPIPIGNVRTDSLRQIWTSSAVLSSLRDKTLYQGKCGDCKRWASCRGCRAIAFAVAGTGGIDACLAEDPQCFLA
ncbi:MAG: radical SAM protein [Thermodesulfovibrionales bacterium]